jgi:hypothetical protein
MNGILKKMRETKEAHKARVAERQAKMIAQSVWRVEHGPHVREVLLDAVAALRARNAGRVSESRSIAEDTKCRECLNRYEQIILERIASTYGVSVGNIYPQYIETACAEFQERIALGKPIAAGTNYNGTTFQYWDGSQVIYRRNGKVIRRGPTTSL